MDGWVCAGAGWLAGCPVRQNRYPEVKTQTPPSGRLVCPTILYSYTPISLCLAFRFLMPYRTVPFSCLFG